MGKPAISSGSKLTDETSFFSSSKSISIRFSKYLTIALYRYHA